MFSASDLSDLAMATASLVGLSAALGAPTADSEAPILAQIQPEPVPSPDLLSPGEPYFEAVAAALRSRGYLQA